MEARMAPYKLINDDCININKYFRDINFDLIYLDPPFGTGSKQILGLHSYDDSSTGTEYLNFISERVRKILNSLSDDGVMLIHLDRHYVYEVKNIIENMGGHFCGDIIWAYRRWASNVNNLQNNHDTILIFSKKLLFKKCRTIFSQSIVAPSSKERVGYPTQKPIGLLKRIITHLEQFVEIRNILDPFMGSGTTLVAGLELGKKVFGFDVSKQAIKIAETRLLKVSPQYPLFEQLDL